jgi:hypothetical protein
VFSCSKFNKIVQGLNENYSSARLAAPSAENISSLIKTPARSMLLVPRLQIDPIFALGIRRSAASFPTGPPTAKIENQHDDEGRE